MKLSYSIAGKLWWIQNFLDYNTYKGIHDAIIKERKNINLHTAKGIWCTLYEKRCGYKLA